MKKNFDRTYYDRMQQDLDNWKGPFYVNRKDPRLIVPKLNPSLGWTFNLGSRYSIIALILILAIITGYSIFMS